MLAEIDDDAVAGRDAFYQAADFFDDARPAVPESPRENRPLEHFAAADLYLADQVGPLGTRADSRVFGSDQHLALCRHIGNLVIHQRRDVGLHNSICLLFMTPHLNSLLSDRCAVSDARTLPGVL